MWSKQFIFVSLYLVAAFNIPVATSAQESALRVLRAPQMISQQDLVYDYYMGLLRLALAEGADGKSIPQVIAGSPMEQKRVTHELMRGELVDINWMALNDERRNNLQLIPVPLDRGLMGFRRLIIHQKNSKKIHAINSLAQLTQLRACQGLDWPDTMIMRAAGLQVVEVAGFENIFQQVVAQRCDYFPRGYLEVDQELAIRQKTYPELVVPQLMIYYPSSLFYFVNKQEQALAQWIQLGLERLIDNGKFMAYMHSHALTRQYFPLRFNGSLIAIPNPYLPVELGTNNSRYWFQVQDFLATQQ